jgi:hypothetical protein
MNDLIDFLGGQGCRIMTTHKARYLWSRFNKVKNVVWYMTAIVTLYLYQHIAGIKHARRFDTFVPTHFNNRLGRNQDFVDFCLKISIADARLQTVAHLFLVPGVRM